MRYFYLVLLGIFITSCASPYTNEEIANDFKIEDFRNLYTMQSDQTDSIFKVFDDKELKKLANIALEQNSDIFIFDSRIKVAESQIKIATSKFLPTIDGSASYQFNRDSTINTNLMASWELDIFGKYASSKDAFKEMYEAAKSNLDFFKISLVSDVSLIYFNIKYLQTNIILTRERIKNYYDLLEVMQVMYRNGFINFSDFLENKALLQQEEQTLNTLLNDYEAKKNELRILINNKDYKFEDSMYDFSIPKFHVNLSNSVDIILNRPDIKSQISSLNAAVYNLNSIKASLYPNITLSGSLGKTLLSPNGVGDLAYQILTSLTLPLFSRMEIYENIKISDYTRLETYYTLQKAIHLALSEIENAIYALENNQKTLHTSIQMLEENKEILQVLKESNELGLIDFIEYLTALNSNLLMIKNNNTSYFNTISATIFLYRSIGGNIEDIKNDNEISSQNLKGELNE